jgi:Flp pilus assembly protein TadG
LKPFAVGAPTGTGADGWAPDQPCLRGDGGQSTVELALCLPFVLGLLLALVQAGLFVRDQVMVDHAAREAVRVAAVSGDASRIRAAAVGASDALDGRRLTVDVGSRGPPGTPVRVVIAYDSPVRVPVIGFVRSSVHLTASATILVET